MICHVAGTVLAATERVCLLAAGETPLPALLHDHLKVIRQAKIDRALA